MRWTEVDGPDDSNEPSGAGERMISHIHIRYFHPAENPGSVQPERRLNPLADGEGEMTFRLYDPERQKNAAMPEGMTA